MSALVERTDDIVANILRLHDYAIGSAKEARFHADRMRMGKRFVAYVDDDETIFCPSKFAGYKDNDLSHAKLLGERHGTTTSIQITRLVGNPLYEDDEGYKEIDRAFERYCEAFKISPTRWDTPRSFWVIRTRGANAADAGATSASDYEEGARISVLTNRFERDYRARKACIQHYGAECAVCKLEFAKFYSGLGEGFIHVHHLVPISQAQGKYKVDPISDLRPVCPNCHAMLHWGGGELMSIEDLKLKISR